MSLPGVTYLGRRSFFVPLKGDNAACRAHKESVNRRVYHAGLTTKTTQRLRRFNVIVTVDFLLFEFRIYVELDAEESDVRPVGRGALYAPDRPVDLSAVDNFLPHRPTAYEWADDRVFGEQL